MIKSATDAIFLLEGVHRQQAAATARDFDEARAVVAALAAKCAFTRQRLAGAWAASAPRAA